MGLEQFRPQPENPINRDELVRLLENLLIKIAVKRQEVSDIKDNNVYTSGEDEDRFDRSTDDQNLLTDLEREQMNPDQLHRAIEEARRVLNNLEKHIKSYEGKLSE